MLNILIAGSLSLLWGLLNSLQLLTYFPLMNVILPENAKIYFDVMFEVSNFDMIPMEYFEDAIVQEVGEDDLGDEIFDAESKLSDSTIDAGYDSANSATNNALNLILLSSIICLVILGVILRLLCYKFQRVRNFLQKLKRAIFWNFILRFVLEAYLEISLANLIKLHAISDKTWFEAATSTYSISVLALMALFCLLTPVFLHKKADQLEEPEFVSKYGALTLDMKTKLTATKFFQT